MAVPEIAELPTLYHAGDSWELFDAVAPVFDKEYAKWRKLPDQQGAKRITRFRGRDQVGGFAARIRLSRAACLVRWNISA